MIATGMAKDPDKRYQTAHALATAARQALRAAPTAAASAPTLLDESVPQPAKQPTVPARPIEPNRSAARAPNVGHGADDIHQQPTERASTTAKRNLRRQGRKQREAEPRKLRVWTIVGAPVLIVAVVVAVIVGAIITTKNSGSKSTATSSTTTPATTTSPTSSTSPPPSPRSSTADHQENDSTHDAVHHHRGSRHEWPTNQRLSRNTERP